MLNVKRVVKFVGKVKPAFFYCKGGSIYIKVEKKREKNICSERNQKRVCLLFTFTPGNVAVAQNLQGLESFFFQAKHVSPIGSIL